MPGKRSIGSRTDDTSRRTTKHHRISRLDPDDSDSDNDPIPGFDLGDYNCIALDTPSSVPVEARQLDTQPELPVPSSQSTIIHDDVLDRLVLNKLYGDITEGKRSKLDVAIQLMVHAMFCPRKNNDSTDTMCNDGEWGCIYCDKHRLIETNLEIYIQDKTRTLTEGQRKALVRIVSSIKENRWSFQAPWHAIYDTFLRRVSA